MTEPGQFEHGDGRAFVVAPRVNMKLRECSHEIVEACIDAIFICDGRGYVIEGNSAATSIFGVQKHLLSGKPLVEVLCEKEKQNGHRIEVTESFARLTSSGSTVKLNITGCRASGEEFPLELTLVRLRDSYCGSVAAFARDVSEQKRAKEFASRQQEILEMIGGSSASLPDILRAVATLVESQLPGALCSILTIDKQNRLRSGVAPSLPQSFRDVVDGLPIGANESPCGVAAYSRQVVIVEDIATDPIWQNQRQTALDHGLRSCWSAPLLANDGRLLGTFAVYYRKPYKPAQSEVETLAAVAHLAALAIGHQIAEDAVRESENRFRSVLDNAQDANYRCDLTTGRMDYVSPAITQISGYTVDEFISLGVKGFMDLIHPDDRPEVDQVVSKVNSGILPYGNVEYRLATKNGEYCWLNDRFTTLRSENGMPLFWVGSLQDIDARKQMKSLLEASNRQYDRQHQALTQLTRSQILQTPDLSEALIEVTETVATVLDVERVSIWRLQNKCKSIECQELFELSKCHHSSGQVLHEDDYPTYFNELMTSEVISADDARADPRTREFSESYLKPLNISSMLDAPIQFSGSLKGVVCLEHVGNQRQWRNDEQTFLVSIANLVSLILAQWELSRAEEAVRVSEANLATAQRIARLGSWTWDLKTGQQRWSDEVYELLGLAPGSVTPGHDVWTRHVHPDDLTRVGVLIEDSCASGSRYDCEYRVVHLDGTELVLQEQAEVSFDAEGKVAYITGTILDITARKRAEQRLLHDAMHDGLTGLANRTLISDHADVAFHLFQRHRDRKFALIMGDIDRFKNVNDTLGHQMGDRVLQEAARRVRAASRAGDTVARLGGDEFAVLLEDIPDEESSTRVAQRILNEMEAPFIIGDTILDVGMSLGVVVATDSHISTEQIFRDSDIALYRAKAAGRGAYQVFDQEMHLRILERLKLEADLRRAIEREELQLYLQPIVSLHTGKIVSFEALLRWQHHEKGFVSPAVFIPIAEESKQIIQIGNWVTRRACEIIRDWPGSEAPSISINVSPVQLLNSINGTSNETRNHPGGWHEEIAEIAADTGVDPKRLGIEVTEGVLIGDPAHVSVLLDRLVGKGFRLLLDDFGTGYSSLSYLQDLPFYQVKLDAAFTAKLKPQSRSHELTRGIITLAHSIGLEVVAEGVETEEQLALLRQAGCDHVQGYLLSHPQPVHQAHELYRSERKW